jgi:hypothetical protein
LFYIKQTKARRVLLQVAWGREKKRKGEWEKGGKGERRMGNNDLET